MDAEHHSAIAFAGRIAVRDAPTVAPRDPDGDPAQVRFRLVAIVGSAAQCEVLHGVRASLGERNEVMELQEPSGIALVPIG